jgi:hypothetical protein
VKTEQYQRKPIIVEAVLVTEENFFDVAHWCQGAIVSGSGRAQSMDEIKKNKSKFIKVRVINPQRVRQTKAYVGDWVLYSEYNGYKVYTDGAFKNAFFGPVNKSVEEAVEELRETSAGQKLKEELNGEQTPDGTYGGARKVGPEVTGI